MNKLSSFQIQRLIRYAELKGRDVEITPWGEIRIHNDYTYFCINNVNDIERIFGRNGVRAII